MRTITLLAAGIAAATSLTACGSAMQLVGQDDHRAENRKFVAYVHQEIPASNAMPDRRLIGMGRKVCERLDNEGASSLLTDLADSDQSMVATVVAAAVTIYCPEHTGAVEAWADSAGDPV